ncbi:MFS transporter [Paractinoplanes atraurantiacus]|uniref:Drug resistance transporter, EmrB/QacA subfamily n=1 Tax=Paractinoplanes atraurantiacus TaxID=1036182 RepID=A0A285K269_9ACTN|nr:MFS transporter [Actinoplanes atraurantiacus]SNY66107.1 drug resistance transporter, EmrB/QacA subfamily [Actinoplanes atraurantiacus]
MSNTIDDPRRRRLILIAVCVALMAVIASVTGLNVAQPELAVEFGASQSEVLWIINSYTMTLAALLLPLGAFGDRRGRKPVLLLGLLLFGAANVAAGLATSAEIMLASRIVSGAGAAMIMPVTLAVITSTFPEEERSKGIGVWTAVAGGGGILGMYLSALLVDVATWRWLFVLPVVLVLVSFAMVARSVPDSREHTAHRFDTVGSAASAVAVLALIFVLHEGPVNGWTKPSTVIGLGAGLLAAIGFVVGELRQPAPLLDIRLFRRRGLAGGSLVLLVVFGVQAGIFVVLFPFLQAVLGWSALRATLAMMPMALLMMLASGLAPKVSARIGSRATMALGILAGGAGLALMAILVSVDGGYRSVLPGTLAMGLGMGLSMTPSTEAITGSLPAESQGVASALNDVTREFGTALGVALLGAVLSAGYRGAIESRLNGVPADVAGTAREGVANAIAVAGESGTRAEALLSAAKESFVDGWQQAMWAGAAVMAALLVYVVARGPQRVAPSITGKVPVAGEPALGVKASAQGGHGRDEEQ